MILKLHNAIIKSTKTNNTIAVSTDDSYFHYKKDRLVIERCEVVIPPGEFDDIFKNDIEVEVNAFFLSKQLFVGSKQKVVRGKIIAVIGNLRFRAIEIEVTWPF